MPMPRPPLPTRHANPHITTTLNSGMLPPVKYQILNCQGQDILVGRLKIETPTPSGHAFILRRFDTGAVSLTTMYRAAFPNAPDHEEKAEVQWVKDNYDLSGNNGSSRDNHITRLAGTWVDPHLALELGQAYSLDGLIATVVEAKPDPNGNYRRSGKSVATPAAASMTTPSSSVAPVSSNPTSRALPTPSPTAALPNPTKRRRESSPVPVSTVATATTTVTSPPMSFPAATKVPLPRRSARTKSPAPRSSATVAPLAPGAATSRTPKNTKTARREVFTPGGSDETVVDEEGEAVEDDIAGSELHQQDINEQRALIEGLKARRVAALKNGSTIKELAVGSDAVDVEGPTAKKRVREDEGGEKFKFDFKEPEVGERAIATNSRVGRFHLEPRTKSFVWGVAAFVAGMGAVSFLPSLF